MVKPAPSSAESIPLAATRSPREMHNSLIRDILELNLMSFRFDRSMTGSLLDSQKPIFIRAKCQYH